MRHLVSIYKSLAAFVTNFKVLACSVEQSVNHVHMTRIHADSITWRLKFEDPLKISIKVTATKQIDGAERWESFIHIVIIMNLHLFY